MKYENLKSTESIKKKLKHEGFMLKLKGRKSWEDKYDVL